MAEEKLQAWRVYRPMLSGSGVILQGGVIELREEQAAQLQAPRDCAKNGPYIGPLASPLPDWAKVAQGKGPRAAAPVLPHSPAPAAPRPRVEAQDITDEVLGIDGGSTTDQPAAATGAEFVTRSLSDMISPEDVSVGAANPTVRRKR